MSCRACSSPAVRTLRLFCACILVMSMGAGCGACDPGMSGVLDMGGGDGVDGDMPDAGEDMRDGDHAKTVDEPQVVSISPPPGAQLEDPTTAEIRVAFSKPMNPDIGRVAFDGATAETSLTWSQNDQLLTFGLPQGVLDAQTVRGELRRFEDREGIPLAPFAFTYILPDTTNPSIRRTEPVEGGQLAGTRGRITFFVTESVVVDDATATLAGGAGEVLGVELMGDTILVEVSGLAPTTGYTLDLTGVTDLAGNPLDTSVFGPDGLFDFDSGPDVDAPVVTMTSPMEGQMDVEPAGLDTITVAFSEPMDTIINSAELLDSTNSVTRLSGTWNADATEIVLDASEVAWRQEEAYRLDLMPFQDRAGNDLDGGVILGDGVLDFTTGPDTVAPMIRSIDPADGAIEVPEDLSAITVVFSEAMSPISGSSVELRDEDGDPIPGIQTQWRAQNTTLVVDLSGALLDIETTYTLDLRGVIDLSGNSLATQEVTFTTRSGSGEDCTEPLDATDAVVDAAGGLRWTIAREAVRAADGGAGTCDPSGTGRDLVIAYDKTQPSLTNGGAALRVQVDSDDEVVVRVLSGACDPASAQAISEQCLWNNDDWTQDLDLGAGRVYLWIATASTNVPFPATTVRVSEEPAAAGESCLNPYDTASATFDGVTTQGTSRWILPAGSINGAEFAPAWDAPSGTIACSAESGKDAVIAYDKQRATSLLRVDVSSQNAGFAAGIDAEIATSCDTTGAPQSVLRCADSTVEARFDGLTAPAGPVFIRLATDRASYDWPEVTVEVTEIDAAAGESCPTALTLIPSAGQQPVQNASTKRITPPACVAPMRNVEWYTLTTTQETLQIDAAGGVAVVEPGTGEVLSCAADASATPIDLNLGAGREVCVAAEVGAFGAWSVTESAPPPGTTCATALPITDGANAITDGVSARCYGVPATFAPGANVAWYAVTATQNIMRLTTDAAAEVAVVATVNGAADRVLATGEDAVAALLDASSVGQKVCVAVEQGRSASTLTLEQRVYTGVAGPATGLSISPPPTAITAERWMVVTPTQLVMAHLSTAADFGLVEAARAPQSPVLATFADAADGVALSWLGYGATSLGSRIFSLDDATGPMRARIWELSYDGSAMTWSASPIDSQPAYPQDIQNEEMRAIATDGTDLLFATYATAPTPTAILSVSPTTGTAPTVLGRVSSLHRVTGLAADATYLYAAAIGPDGEGVYRIPRADLAGAATPELLASVPVNTAFVSALVLDDPQAPQNLYVRDRRTGAVHTISGPQSASPVAVGAVADVGRFGDVAMAWDATADRLIVFATDAAYPDGRFLSLE